MDSECSFDSTITSSVHHSLSTYSDEESIYFDTSGSEDSIHIERPVIDNPCIGAQSNLSNSQNGTNTPLQSLQEWTKSLSLPKSLPEEWPDDEPRGAQKRDLSSKGRTQSSLISEAGRNEANYVADPPEVTPDKTPTCAKYVPDDVEVTPDFCRIGNEWHTLWSRNKSAPSNGLHNSKLSLCHVEGKSRSLSSRNHWIGATCNPTSFESDDTVSTLPEKVEDDNSNASVRISEIQIYTSKISYPEGVEHRPDLLVDKNEDETGKKVPQRQNVMETDQIQTLYPLSQDKNAEVACVVDDDDDDEYDCLHHQEKKEQIIEKQNFKFLSQNGSSDIETPETKVYPATVEDTGNTDVDVEVTLGSFCDEYEENQPLHGETKIKAMARPMKKILRVVQTRRTVQRPEGTERVIVCDQTKSTRGFSQEVELMNLDTFSDEGQDNSSYTRKKYSILPCIVFCCLLLVACVLAVAVATIYFGEKQSEQTQDAANALTESATVEGGMSEILQDISASPSPSQTKPLKPSPTMAPVLRTKMPSPLPTKMPSPSPTKIPSPSPTGPPSTLPTPSPTRCVTQIASDFQCYNRNEDVDIVVSFAQCNPNVDDWVGVYPAGSNGQILGENYLEWSWACGNQECQGETFSNSIPIMDAESLEVGWYQAFLLRENDFGEYRSLASSVFFLVSNSQCE